MIFSLRSRCRSCFFHCRRSFRGLCFFLKKIYSINLPFLLLGVSKEVACCVERWWRLIAMADRSRLQPGLALLQLLLLLLLLVSSVAEAKDLYKAINFFLHQSAFFFFTPSCAVFAIALLFQKCKNSSSVFFFLPSAHNLGLEYITSTRIGRLIFT